MCRVLGYIGPRLRLGALIEDPPHSLVVQSYAAKELGTSVVAADGWGAAWYLDTPEPPCVYRSTLPIWGDANRQDLNRAVESRCLLSAVRSATDPVSIAVGNTQPFKFEDLCFLHNGFLRDFANRWMRPLRKTLSERAYACLRGVSDSEHIFALIVDEWLARADRDSASRLQGAVEGALQRLAELAEKLGEEALLTLLVANGKELVAVRSARNAKAPTLYALDDGLRGVYFASEPLDGEREWRALAEGQLWRAHLDAPPIPSTLG
jgi:glutamine amidotransferase